MSNHPKIILKILLVAGVGMFIFSIFPKLALAAFPIDRIYIKDTRTGLPPACDDLIDNDNDGKIDGAGITNVSDPECSGPTDTSELPPRDTDISPATSATRYEDREYTFLQVNQHYLKLVIECNRGLSECREDGGDEFDVYFSAFNGDTITRYNVETDFARRPHNFMDPQRDFAFRSTDCKGYVCTREITLNNIPTLMNNKPTIGVNFFIDGKGGFFSANNYVSEIWTVGTALPRFQLSIPQTIIPTTALPKSPPCRGYPLAECIANLQRYGIYIGAALAVVILVWAGILWSLSESITSKETAKHKIKMAVTGLLILLGSFLLLMTINPELVSLGSNVPRPSGSASSGSTLSATQNCANDLTDYGQTNLDPNEPQCSSFSVGDNEARCRNNCINPP